MFRKADEGEGDVMGIDTGGRDVEQRVDRLGEDRARAAVLEMTRAVLDEVGYQRLRPETVAARAGVPRSWLRRWWTTRPLLVAEALAQMDAPPDIMPTGDVRADVHAVVLRTAAFLANPMVGDALAGLAADAGRDPVAAERLTALLAARRAGDTAVLLSAVARGDLRPDTDVRMVLDVLFGALLFRLARGAAPTPEAVEALVDLVLHGQAVPPDEEADGHRADGLSLDGHRLEEYEPAAPAIDGNGNGNGDGDGHAPDGHAADGHRSRMNLFARQDGAHAERDGSPADR